MGRLKPRYLFSLNGEGRYTGKEIAEKMGTIPQNLFIYEQKGYGVKKVARLKWAVTVGGKRYEAWTRSELAKASKVSVCTLYKYKYDAPDDRIKVECYWEDIDAK